MLREHDPPFRERRFQPAAAHYAHSSVPAARIAVITMCPAMAAIVPDSAIVAGPIEATTRTVVNPSPPTNDFIPRPPSLADPRFPLLMWVAPEQ